MRLLRVVLLLASPLLVSAAIDRRDLVGRHDVHAAAIDSSSPLTVGNGEFGFTADVTGLQTLNATYVSFPPLQTMSHWGWHKIPAALAGVNPPSYQYERVTVGAHTADYATNCTKTPEYNYLRENPHRINLARVFLRRLGAGKPIEATDVTAIDQTLHLWNGSLASAFSLDGERVSVATAVHPELDVLAVRVCSALVAKGSVGVGLAFPYAAAEFAGGTDWRVPARHTSTALPGRPEVVNHTLDNTTYFVHAAGGTLQSGQTMHDWTITGEKGAQCLAATFWFSPVLQPPQTPLPSADEVFAASASGWAKQWLSGAALDLSGSTADGATELERRVVLSQYIMMSQEAGSNPPQETGLMTNSWYGKFHLEMRWHHQFHFTLWGRGELAQRADSFFDAVREPARDFTLRRQHYTGVRWPKMVAPPDYMTWAEFEDPTDASRPFWWYDGPSGAGPWILWQQPHPLSFAEMAYRAEPSAATLARYNQTVHDTADFMADFVLQQQSPPAVAGGCYSLGAPMFTAEIESFEGRPAAQAKDGTFELVYWRFGLHIANLWRQRQALPAEPRWSQAELGICAPLPRKLNGTGPLVYYPYSNSSVDEPFAPGYAVQLFANAWIPGAAHGLNASVMAETVRQSLHALDINRLPWCSDPPLYAMAAARLGMAELATEFLLQPKNENTGGTMRYLTSGHCQIKGFLPVYTPGNGALLSAVAMMVGGGWDEDNGKPAPGLPQDGSWKVQAEGFHKMF